MKKIHTVKTESAKQAIENINQNETYQGIVSRRKSAMHMDKYNPVVMKLSSRLTEKRGLGRILKHIAENPNQKRAQINENLGYRGHNHIPFQTMLWGGLISSKNPGYKITELGQQLLSENGIQ